MHRKVKMKIGDEEFYIGSCVLDVSETPNYNGDIFLCSGMTIPSGEITFKHDDKVIGKILESYKEKV